jgi:hypothetical protein
MCEQEVLPGDHVVFGHGEFIHLNCHLIRDGAAAFIARFLKSHASAEYCHGCLHRVVQHSTLEQVVKAVTHLRMTSRYRVTAVAMCSVCGAQRTTIRAEPAVLGGGS